MNYFKDMRVVVACSEALIGRGKIRSDVVLTKRIIRSS
jgi:hypothetical protein